MITHYPVPLLQPTRALGPARSRPPVSPALRPLAPAGSWRYRGLPRPWWTLPFSALVTATFLGLVFFGIGRHRTIARPVEEEKYITVSLEMPDLKELEEPEHAPLDDAPPPDLGQYAPSLADVPQLILPDSFVQPFDFASLIPPPDFSAANVLVIPPHIRHGDGSGGGIGDIFNLKDLDRVPEPILQPPPVFPFGLRRSVDVATVRVEFIVDVTGRVLSPVAIESTLPGFDEAATTGVQKWKFRPGMKAGRKVNTRMIVPIIFRTMPDDL